MKYQKIIIFSLLTIALSAALFKTASEKTSEPVEQTTLQTQTITDGPVTYKVTLKNVATKSETWDFEISLDTHTESLDQDLIAIVRLVDDKGNEYKATQWEGAPPGGHHREGILKFSPLSSRPAFIELNIQTIDDAKKASLRWTL